MHIQRGLDEEDVEVGRQKYDLHAVFAAEASEEWSLFVLLLYNPVKGEEMQKALSSCYIFPDSSYKVYTVCIDSQCSGRKQCRKKKKKIISGRKYKTGEMLLRFVIIRGNLFYLENDVSFMSLDCWI